MTSRNYCFTRNFSSAEAANVAYNDLTWHEELPSVVKYCVFQVETAPTTGRVHWQGYIELDEPLRIAGVKNKLGDPFDVAHYESRRGTQEQAIAYCKKEPRLAGPFEFGEPARQGKKRVSVLDQATLYIQENYLWCTMSEVEDMFPTATVRYYAPLMNYRLRLLAKHTEDATFEPYPWQRRVLNMLLEDPDDRHIIWVTDTKGNMGKTRLARHLLLQHGAIVLSGKTADMIYAYKQKMSRIAIFDVTRSAAEHSDNLYTMAEMLKNGAMMNSKYESGMFCFPAPHVVFFANFSWDRSKWSNDRVIEIDLSVPEPPPPSEEDMAALDRCLEDVFRFC